MKRIGIFGKTNKGSSEENNNNNDPGGGDEEDEDAAAAGDSVVNVFKKKNNPLRTTQREVQQQQQSQQQQQHSASATVARPNYRSTTAAEHDEEEEDNSSHHQHHQNNNNNNQDDDEYNNHDNNNNTNNNAHHNVPAENIEKSAGSTRLNRILRTTQETSSHAAAAAASTVGGSTILNSSSGKSSRNLGSGGDTAATASSSNNNTTGDHQRVSNPRNWREIAHFCSRHVVPPLKVDSSSIGGSMLDSYPESMQQECLLASLCESFESSTTTMTSTTTTSESVVLSALQYPHEYNKHKRMLGSLGGGMAATKGGGGAAHHHHHQRANASKIRYVILARSTNRPMLSSSQKRQYEMMRLKQQQQQSAVLQQQQQSAVQGEDEVQPNQQQQRLDKDLSDRGDYDAMFSPEDSEYDDDNEEDDDENGRMKRTMDDKNVKNTTSMTTPAALLSDGGSLNQKSSLGGGDLPPLLMDDEEVSSFPVLICMTLQSDGTGPDIRKLIPLDQLTTVQDLHSTVVQLAFSNGDTIRLDFGSSDGVNDTHKNTSSVLVERPLDKERFLWSLLQIHAMLCMAVVERNSRGAATFLPPLNVRNLDRAELQYVATINGFLKQNEILKILLERQQKAAIEHEAAIAAAAVSAGEEKQRDEIMDIDTLAYNLMMGNFATRVVLFHSEDERKDAEEILNSADWTDMLNSKEETAAVSVAERLGFMLQSRMRDLEAETCRRLIAWEDEKHLSLGGRAKLHDVSDARDTVDALALASLFKTLESLDAELKAMEDWLQDRAGAIKPLTDDCADIEEENRQLEQQWKSYDMLGAEMRRLLHGQEIDETTKGILRNPASVLLYDETGQVNVEESELGIERIYEAGKALLEALEFVSGTQFRLLDLCVSSLCSNINAPLVI